MTRKPTYEELEQRVKELKKFEAESKQAEEVLRESEEKYRALIESTPDIIMQFDQDCSHLYVSPTIEKIIKLRSSDFIGKTHRELGFPEEQILFWEQSIRKVFDSSEPFETEFEFEGVSGHVIFNWRIFPERDVDGRIATVMSVARDITEQRKSEQEYQTLFDKMLNGFALHEIIYNDEGIPIDYRFLAVNSAFERMTGLSAISIVGKTVLEVLPGTEEHWIQTYGQVALTGQPIHFENYAQEAGSIL